jgi:hypothetical protein
MRTASGYGSFTWLSSLCLAGLAWSATAAELPEGYWGPDTIEPLLERTLTVRLEPDLSSLTEAERETVQHLLAVGRIFHRLYLESRHHQSLSALGELEARGRSAGTEDQTRQLLDLFWIFKGPIATTLDNRRVPFLPVDPELPGKNVYPTDVTREEVRTRLETHPDESRDVLDLRSVVRRATRENLDRDRAVLERHPVLRILHPGLEHKLEALAVEPDSATLYAVPYSVAYAEEILEAYRLLQLAARTIRETDPDFAAYLANRARDLLADDYEAGDASWVAGRFGKLNAQIGSSETYDDELLGVKSFFSLSLLVRDQERSAKLAAAISGLQDMENRLPYGRPKKVRSEIPVGVYHVVADFGQARGTNTATILPNDSSHARKYGRTILMRYNIMTHPDLFANTRAGWAAAVADSHDDDLTLEGNFNRTLWHEVGHYLGPDRDARNRTLDVALAEYSDLVEELKADLVSLEVAPKLRQSGYYDEAGLRAVYADGIRRTLQRVRPRPEQPYQTMQLMQMNFFLEKGLLEWDAERQELVIHFDRYPETVTGMLREVLAIQSSGDVERAARLVEEYAVWTEDLHEALASRIREAAIYRYRRVLYAALGQ